MNEEKLNKFKQTIIRIFAAIGAFLSVITGVYFLRKRRTNKVVQDIGTRIRDTAIESGQSEDLVRESREDVSRLEESIESQSEQLGNAKRIVEKLGSEAKSQRERLDESQAILDAVRKRGATED